MESTLILTSALIVLCLAALIVVFAVTYQRKIWRERTERKAMEVEHQLELFKSTLEAQENEQARIAKDLHDDLGALLSTIKLHVVQFGRKNRDNPEVQTHTQLVDDMLSESVQNVRRIASNLLSPTLKEIGLEAALNELKERINQAGGMQFDFVFATRGKRLPAGCEVPLYRIIQELLNNSLKHAQASKATLELRTRNHQIALDYRDNGQGMDLNAVNKHIGLDNLESRAALLKGSIEFTSHPGSGFAAHLQAPLPVNSSLSS